MTTEQHRDPFCVASAWSGAAEIPSNPTAPRGGECTSDPRVCRFRFCSDVTFPEGLTPTDGTRVIPPGALNGCPIAIKSVVASLPTGAEKFAVTMPQLNGQDTSADVYVTRSGSEVIGYFPARLPDGRTVYVSIGSGPVSVGGPAINIQQASELAQGLIVSPAALCTAASGC